MRPIKAPLGLTQLVKGPRSSTASCTCTGSTRRSRAAGPSMRFNVMNPLISSASISLMIRISSRERPRSSPSPKRKPKPVLGGGKFDSCVDKASAKVVGGGGPNGGNMPGGGGGPPIGGGGWPGEKGSICPPNAPKAGGGGPPGGGGPAPKAEALGAAPDSDVPDDTGPGGSGPAGSSPGGLRPGGPSEGPFCSNCSRSIHSCMSLSETGGSPPSNSSNSSSAPSPSSHFRFRFPGCPWSGRGPSMA
mmetsp:Transcript_22668/g.57667  ORF Transcript_22668/g.57667 Transcript_22668/m.57667 type:complete len:247 (-) Transcript_22668:80-820(-)